MRRFSATELAKHLENAHPRLIDVQWRTDHLARLGVSTVDRASYRRRLPTILATPDAPLFSDRIGRIVLPQA